MELNNNIINNLFDKVISFVDNDLNIYNYNDDIKHLLYIIIPSFILKYGFKKDKIIYNTFKNVPIMQTRKEELYHQAYYTSIPKYDNNEIKTYKFININWYDTKNYIEIIDNIVHEYNHAINSELNEILLKDKYIYLRTGLTYRKYNKDLTPIGKDKAYILEEIINTKQTEEVIEVINSLNKFDISNYSISTTLSSVSNHIFDKFKSNAYNLQSAICRKLLDNHTLINVLSDRRLNGNIDDIRDFFDNITGIDNSYYKLINYLYKTTELETEYSKKRFFKKHILDNIRSLYKDIDYIISKFNNNYIYK